MKERNRLGIDFSKLYRTTTMEIGGTMVTIRPLTYVQWAELLSKADLIIAKCKEADITMENYREPAKALALAKIIVVDFIDVLAEVSNIHEDDLKALPIEIVVDILGTVIEINLASKEDLEKNFNRLTKILTPSVKSE